MYEEFKEFTLECFESVAIEAATDEVTMAWAWLLIFICLFPVIVYVTVVGNRKPQ